MAETHIDLLIAFRNPHQGERQLGSGLPHRVGRRHPVRFLPGKTHRQELDGRRRLADITAVHVAGRIPVRF